MHTSLVIKDYITASRVPPLFIPDHFFDRKIKIRYGFDDYSSEYVNINPEKTSYIFDSRDGTDLAIPMSDLPAFWRNRVAVIETNPNSKQTDLKDAPLLIGISNPWRDKSAINKNLVIAYRRFHFRIIMPLFGNKYYKLRGVLSKLKKRYVSHMS
jgi:hypothetical protein